MTVEGHEGNDAAKKPVAWRFSWSLVDAKLVRELIVAAYSAKGQPEDVERALLLQDALLADQASRTLGSPPAAKHATALAPVLRDVWLPTLNRATLSRHASLVQLTLTGADQKAPLRTKTELVAFFRRRRLTENLSLLLRQWFIAAHKEAVERAGGSTPSAPRLAARISLAGLGAIDRRVPYEHQRQAWSNLDAMVQATEPERRAGLLVLPTGAGKTHTLVAWLTAQLVRDPGLRVLWLADQQELVDQAARAFLDHAAVMPAGTHRTLRVVHGGGARAAALADDQLDVVCATRQSVTGPGFALPAKKRVAAYLSRPCVVVVDEAHHAVSPTYRLLLDFIRDTADATVMVGLTATPWPKGAAMTARLRQRFPVRVAEVQTRDLVKAGILATPRLHTVDTQESVRLSAEEARQIAGRDVPASVLRDLDRESRNQLIVNTWLSQREMWGKTLVFACDIAHADRLGTLFAKEGVPSVVLHSRSDEDRRLVLKEFRETAGESVLISVGMLLEGVDLPDARTAFLARPTSSRIVLRQMIGRVLRGVVGGGEAVAHIVDLRDRWSADVDVLSPVDLVDLRPEVVDGQDGEHRLPPVLDEITGEPIPEDVLQRIARAYAELQSGFPGVPALYSTELVGFYELGYLNVPVFAHAQDRWAKVIQAELMEQGYLRPLEMFDDLPVPQPVASDVRAVVEFCRSEKVEPPLVPVRSTISLQRVVTALLDAGQLSEHERLKLLLHMFETTLARSAYASFQLFHDAVQQELLRRLLDGTADPEDVPPQRPEPRPSLPMLRARGDRELGPLFLRAAAQGREILTEAAPELEQLLRRDRLPTADWTRFAVTGTWAYWHTKLHGRGKGQPVIRVNRALQAPKAQIPDELLEYLLWHELLHHALPGRGHDGEFRRLESLWPDFARLDFDLDSIDERFDLTNALARR